MDPLEYSFGNGVDAPTTWTSLTDLSVGPAGSLDAIALDFDGDGLLDDAMWDSDGDGVADHSVLDVDSVDGTGEARYFTDPSGTGTWNEEVTRLLRENCPLPTSEPGAGPAWSDGPSSTSADVRSVSFDPHADAVVPMSGNVSRPDLVHDSDTATAVHADGEQSCRVEGGRAQGQAH